MKNLYKLLRFIFIISLLNVGYESFAQHDYTRVAAGYNVSKPYFKNVIGKNNLWQGFNVRTNIYEYGFSRGKMGIPEDTIFHGYNWYMGANVPIKQLKFGNREYGIRGFLAQPFIAGYFGGLGLQNKHVFQFTVSPGMSIQLPYFLVDFKLNTVIPLNADKFHGLKHIIFMPSVSFQLDALWDVMDPILTFDRHEEGVHKSTWSSSRVEGDYLVTTTTTTYTPYSFDVYLYNVGPHVSLGPRASYNYSKTANSALMYGLVQSGRAHGFGYDLIVESGALGYEKGEIKCTRGIVRLQYDCKGLTASGVTQFTRLMFGLGVGRAMFSKKGDYRADDNQFINISLSYELGAVGISWEHNIFFYDTFPRNSSLSLTYRLPYERLAKRYKERHAD